MENLKPNVVRSSRYHEDTAEIVKSKLHARMIVDAIRNASRHAAEVPFDRLTHKAPALSFRLGEALEQAEALLASAEASAEEVGL